MLPAGCRARTPGHDACDALAQAAQLRGRHDRGAAPCVQVASRGRHEQGAAGAAAATGGSSGSRFSNNAARRTHRCWRQRTPWEMSHSAPGRAAATPAVKGGGRGSVRGAGW